MTGAHVGSCRLTVHGPAGPGVLAIVDRRFVWAEYDGLAGEPAAYRVLMLEDGLDYELHTNVEIDRRNMDIDCHRLLVSSHQFKNNSVRTEGEL